MKKYFIAAMVFLATTTAVFAQKRHKTPPNQPARSDSAALVNKALQAAAAANPEPPKPKKVWDLSKRSADHFMFQFGYDNWANKPDSAHISGINHSFNFYFMFDFPFKTDPRLSIGAGLGIGSNNIYFNQTYPLVAAYQNSTLVFSPTVNGNSFKTFKLVTTYLEIPVELRFAVDPEHMDKTWKFAIGTKIGVMLTAYTKGSTPVNSFGQVVAHSVEKESSTQFFNTTKFEPTFRISKGFIGVYGQFQVNPLLKTTTSGQNAYPFAIGLVLSGL